MIDDTPLEFEEKKILEMNVIYFVVILIWYFAHILIVTTIYMLITPMLEINLLK
jgi:hypothetical protein